MKNLIKHELYKLVTSKGIRILFIVLICMMVFSLAMIALMVGALQALDPNASVTDITGLLAMDSSSNFLLYVGIISVILVVNEFSKGTIKLVAMSDVSRFEVYLSKFLSVALATVALIVVQKVLNIIGLQIIVNSMGLPMIYPNFFNGIFIPFLMELLLAVSLVAFCNFFAFWFKNTAGVIAILFGYSVIISILMLVAMFTGSDFLNFLNDISFQQVMINLNTAQTPTHMVNYFISVFINFVPFFIGGYFIFNRQEIK